MILTTHDLIGTRESDGTIELVMIGSDLHDPTTDTETMAALRRLSFG